MAQGPLTADELLTAPQQKLIAHAVSTPEWKEGSFVYVAELTADERDEMEQGWIGYRSQHNGADDDNVGFRAYTVAYCLCDANRQRLFAGRESSAAVVIGQRNGKATARVFNTCSKINGLTKADIDALEKK